MQEHILEERKKIKFDVQRFKVYLQGGLELFQLKMKFVSAAASAPELQMRPDYWALGRKQKYTEIMKQVNGFAKLFTRMGLRPGLAEMPTLGFLMKCVNPYTAHFYLFVEAIKNLSSEEQNREWSKAIEDFKIVATYAQTELAHGSDVQNLQTTATFDRKTDQIIIHTPTLEATKFWPAELGFLANQTLVMAKLIVDGKNYGQHFFLVPLRSPEDHSLLPGVETGDIGPKHGFIMKDNGYAIFTNVRIPRTNMLMRFQELDSEGNYRKKGNPKIIYIQIFTGRIILIQASQNFLARSLIIALRYCAFRRQFKTLGNTTERKVLDYQLVQYRLLPYLSNVFAYFFAYKRLMKEYLKVKNQILNNEPDDLGQLHSIVSGVKAFVTWDTSRGIEDCRECCGGHGYLKSTGISFFHQQQSSYITLEGENAVMAQQTARDLLKNYQKALTGKKTSQITQYLTRSSELLNTKSGIKSEEDLTLAKIEEALMVRACYAVSQVAKEILEKQQDGMKMGAIWNDHVQSDLIRAARYHCELFLYSTFLSQLNLAIQNKEIEDKVVSHLQDQAMLFGIKVLFKSVSELYICGYFEGQEREILKHRFKQSIKRTRAVALGLVEAFNLNDDFLFTTIGSATRNPYEALMEDARVNNPLNRSSTLEGFMKYIKPLMKPKL